MQSKFLIVVIAFFAFIFFIYMPLSYLVLYLKDRKGRAFAREHDAIKFYVKIKKHGGHLEVLSINGEEPVIHRNMKQYGYYLFPGENVIDVRYQWQPFFPNLIRKIFGLTYELGMKQHHLDAEELTIIARAGSEYILYYDHSKKDYVFEEKDN